MDWTYDAERSVFLPEISLHELVDGGLGETITIPNSPPTEGEEGSFDIPPIQIPPIPIGTISAGAISSTSLFGTVNTTLPTGTYKTSVISFSTEYYDDLNAFNVVTPNVLSIVTAGRYEINVFANLSGFVLPDLGNSWNTTSENQAGLGIEIVPSGFAIPVTGDRFHNRTTLYPGVEYNNVILTSVAVGYGLVIPALSSFTVRIFIYLKDYTLITIPNPGFGSYVFLQIRKIL
jgi:hypothetical protein